LENGEKTVGHALQNYLKRSSVRVEDYVVSVSIDGKEVGIIPGGDELTDVFGKLYSGNYRSPEQWIRKFIEDSKIIEMWDFIILDTVPFYERRYTISAFSAADNVVIVTHPYGAEPHRVKRMYNKLKTGGIDVEKKARLLINKAGKGEEGKQPEEKFKDCNIPRFNSVIPDSVYLGRVERQKNKQGMREVKTEYGRLDKHQRDKIENFYKEVKEWLGIAIIEYH
ncbi:MAG: MinD/ParA family protein, partial [Pyrobaculum sp.]